MELKYINPENLVKPRGYSHAVSVDGTHKTIYIGGQNAIDENGNLVGKNNFKEQTEQILVNIEKILKNENAKIDDVIKFNIYILQGENSQEGFEVFQKKWGNKEKYPIVTVLFVAGLGNPDWLLEIEAIAIIPK